MGLNNVAGVMKLIPASGKNHCSKESLVRILVIEDDETVSNFIKKSLKESGFSVDCALDGRDGLFLASEETYDAIILDRMLPKFDGLSILKVLRDNGIATPVLMLSALGEVNHRIEGLRAGSDDYLAKPFSVSELVVRVQVLLRRATECADETSLKVGDLTINPMKRQATRRDRTIDLKPKEYQLLEYMVRHAGNIVTRSMIMEHVWDYHFDPTTNVVDVHISKLRKKIDQGFEKKLVHTIRGAGYCIRYD